jgi:hypothetical protein
MIHDNKKENSIDPEEVAKIALNLIKEHRQGKIDCPDCIGYKYDMENAIYASKVTTKKLAQATGKKIYYEILNYLDNL